MKRLNKDSIRTFFQSDRAILMICIGIALVFWVIVKLSHTFQTQREISIHYHIPEGKTFVETPPGSLKATLKGRGYDLIGDFSGQPIPSIEFPLPDEPSFTINSSLLKSKITNLLSNLEVLDMSYDYIVLNMENKAEKKVPVQFEWVPSFAPEHQLRDSIQITPDSVTLRGPISLLEPIPYWPTSLLSVSELNSDFIGNIPVEPPGNKQLEVIPKEIGVQIPVEQFTEKKMFVPIQIKNAPDSLKIFPEIVQVTCIVGLNKYEMVDENSFSLEVDLTNISLKGENNTLPIQLLRQPDFVRNVKLLKQSVEFFFVQ